MSFQSLVPVLITLQFVAFGWRINREIVVGDEKRRTWLPVSDCVNILSLLSVVSLCMVWPLATGEFNRGAKTALAIGYTLLALHPINMAAHYRLFSKAGRSIYLKTSDNYPYITEGDYPYITDQEARLLPISSVLATVVGCIVWHAA